MSVQVRSGAQGLESKESQPDDTRVAHFIGEAEGRHLLRIGSWWTALYACLVVPCDGLIQDKFMTYLCNPAIEM
jgi:hypothetical protein